MADKNQHTTAIAGEPVAGLSTERLLEIMDGLKRYDKGTQTLVSLAVNPEEKAIKGLPSAPDPKPEAVLFGFPIRTNNFIPPGYGLGETSCGCTCGEVEADGGSLMHMAKHHVVVVKFDPDA